MTTSTVSGDALAEAVSRIPIRNAWYLLLYAWDMASYRGRWTAEAEASPTLLGLLARILASATRNLLRRQLGRAFAIRGQTIRGLRGRLDLTASLKRLTFQARCGPLYLFRIKRRHTEESNSQGYAATAGLRSAPLAREFANGGFVAP